MDNNMQNFKDIEKEVFEFICGIGVSIIKDMLKELDEKLKK